MDISYCRELIALADDLNFSKAAERLYITQSTLSKHVAAVEREVGFRVFDRTTSRVELTEGGRIWIDSLREVVEKYEVALRESRSRQHEADMTVRVIGPLINEHMLSLATMAQTQLSATGREVRLILTDTGVRDCHERLLDRYRSCVSVWGRRGRTALRAPIRRAVRHCVPCVPSTGRQISAAVQRRGG